MDDFLQVCGVLFLIAVGFALIALAVGALSEDVPDHIRTEIRTIKTMKTSGGYVYDVEYDGERYLIHARGAIVPIKKKEK